jgi:hypothetical protein
LERAAVAAGFDMNVLRPKYKRNAPPINRTHNCQWIKNDDTAVNPNPATIPYNPSAEAAPNPLTNPDFRPKAIVR